METSIFITKLESGLQLHAVCHDTEKSAAVKLEMSGFVQNIGFLKLALDLSDVWKPARAETRAQDIYSLYTAFNLSRNSVSQGNLKH